MRTVSLNLGSIDPKRIFFLLLKVLLVFIGILAGSFLVLMLIRGGESKGIVYLLFIIASAIIIIRLYIKNTENPSTLKQHKEIEVYGNLEATAAMIRRASAGYDYSREKLDEIVSDLLGRECHIHGTDAQYMNELEEMMEDI